MAKDPITVYLCGGFGAKTIHANLVEVNPEKRRVTYLLPRKRKPETNNHSTAVVIRGTGPMAPSGLVETETGSRSKYGSFDERYEQEYNDFIENLLKDVSPENVLLDNRKKSR